MSWIYSGEPWCSCQERLRTESLSGDTRSSWLLSKARFVVATTSSSRSSPPLGQMWAWACLQGLPKTAEKHWGNRTSLRRLLPHYHSRCFRSSGPSRTSWPEKPKKQRQWWQRRLPNPNEVGAETTPLWTPTTVPRGTLLTFFIAFILDMHFFYLVYTETFTHVLANMMLSFVGFQLPGAGVGGQYVMPGVVPWRGAPDDVVPIALKGMTA